MGILEFFVFSLSILIFFTLFIGFKILPEERWQFLFSIPVKKDSNGIWQGINFTYYGAIIATTYIFAISIFLILCFSVKMKIFPVILVLIILISICTPASKLVAKVVEKKKYTSSIGGASFVGILLAPIIIFFVKKLLNVPNLDTITLLSAILIGYSFGEGLGRLSCISFGCCYGKALENAPTWAKKIFKNFNFIFSGKTKKISYSHNLDQQPVIPIQGITSIIFSLTGISGFYLFMKGYPEISLILTIITTQLWRSFSEFLRADYRGNYKISAYQIMSIISVCYTIFIVNILKANNTIMPDLVIGLKTLWSPYILLFFQIFWLIIFIYMGKSKVTFSKLSFYVAKDNI